MRLDCYTDISINFNLKRQFAGFSILHEGYEIVSQGLMLSLPSDLRLWEHSTRGEIRAITITIDAALKAIPDDRSIQIYCYSDCSNAIELIRKSKGGSNRLHRHVLLNLMDRVRAIERRKGYIRIIHIPRGENKRAHKLALKASRDYELSWMESKRLFHQEIDRNERKSIDDAWLKTVNS